MKKFRISLIAVLAVVFAAMSAFKFAPVKSDGANLSYVWYVNDQDKTTVDTYQELIMEGQLDVVDPSNGLAENPTPTPAQQAQIDSYAQNHCDIDDPICFALVRFKDGSAEALQIVKFGLYF